MTERSELLIRNAYVLTMDAAVGDIAGGDVHVRAGAIAAVGRSLAAPQAEVIDGAGMLVLPGFVETHWHVWTTLLRSLAGDRQEHGYFPTSRTVGTFYTADDMYAAGRLAAAEAVHSGITFVARLVPQRSRARVRGSRVAGARGSPAFARGSRTVRRRARATTRRSISHDLTRLRERWSDHSNGGLLTLGLAWRGAASAATLRDYEVAKELGLPISVHANNFQTSAGGIAAARRPRVARPGHAGHPRGLVHAGGDPRARRQRARRQRVAVLGAADRLRFPIVAELLDGGVNVGLSVDTPALSRQCRHVRDHEGDSEHRERPSTERIQAHGTPRARARHDRRRALDGDRRQSSAR